MKSNVSRAVAALATGVLAAGLVAVVSYPKQASAIAPAMHPYLGPLVTGKHAAPKGAELAQPRLAANPAPHLPAPVTSHLTWPASAPQQIGQSGITVVAGSAYTRHTVSKVQAQILDQATAASHGLSGLVLRLVRTDHTNDAQRLSIRVPPGTLRGLFGADYERRLHWTSLPDTTTRDALSRGYVKPTPLAGTARPDGSAVIQASATSRPMLVAATTGPVSSGGAGTYAATSLRGDGSWSVSTQAGDFTWSYPLRAPAAAAGPSPQMALSYDSGSVDAETAATNNQSSVVGDGWQLAGTGFIERSYTPCFQDGSNLSSEQTASGDLCWSGENDTISFGGHSGALIPTGTADEYRIQGDDGSRVRYLTGVAGCSDGGSRGGCWQLTTQDGTRYFFGRSANSAWTVPVFGDDAGEPCHGTTFTTSACTQTWRWNLDEVVDLHGTSETFAYTTETNYYHQDNAGLVPYVRSGYLTEIDYGIPAGGSASDRILFGYDPWGRCNVATPSASNCADQTGSTHPTPPVPANYPDVPWDQNCVAGGACTGLNTPTFWTAQKLVTITTQAMVSGAWTNADVWMLHHLYVDPGDTSAASMWLNGISHPGLSDTQFTPISLNNRVDTSTYLPLAKQRIGDIRLDSGADIAVSYDSSDCTPSSVKTLNPMGNTARCFPQYWSPTGSTPTIDWFNKYRVNAVSEIPNTGGSTDPSVLTQYVYTSSPAWRLDVSASTPTAQRTWSVFAGYRSVEVRTGDQNIPAQQQTTDYQFFQGLDQDPTGNNTYRTSTLTGNGHTATDSLQFAGQTFETIVRNGSSGGTGQSTTPVVTDTVSIPWSSASAGAAATRSFLDPTPGASNPVTFTASIDNHAYLTGDGTTYASSAVSTGGTRTVNTTTTNDSYGRVTQVAVATPDAGSTCTVTEYATDPTGHTDTNLWLLDLPRRKASASSACGTTPNYPTDAIYDKRFYYDDATDLAAQTLSTGELTETDVVKDYNGTGDAPETMPVTKTPKADYDSLGRPLQVTNANGTTTTTSYTPAAAGPLTASSTTVAAGTSLAMTTTTTYTPLWAQPTSTTDPNGNITRLAYDSLGRRTGVWLPNRPQASNPTSPSVAYGYVTSATQPQVTSATTLNTAGGTITAYAFADGLGRPIQTQSAMDSADNSGNHLIGGTVITDTYYDKAGRVALVDNPFGTTSVTPSTNWFDTSKASQVPRQTQTTWDGAGRKTADITLGTNPATQTFGELWRTGYAHPGTDRTDVTPPSGGTPTTTLSDSLGRTSELDTYLNSTPTGTKQATTYSYNGRGDLTGMTDPAQHNWSWTYDPLGHQTQAVDPDTGKTTTTYDPDGNVATVSNGSHLIKYDYDVLDRKIKESESAGTNLWAQVAGWTYDTATLGKGLAASSTRYVGSTATTNGTAYTQATGAYNSLGEPTSSSATIPGWNSGNPYTKTIAYNANGSLLGTIEPAMGGLLGERVSYNYDLLDNLTSLGGTTGYLNNQIFDSTNQPAEMVFKNGSTELDRLYTYESNTGRLHVLNENVTATSLTHIASHTYTYDNAGLVTEDSNLADGQVTDNQCYTYDHLEQLTEAWTPSTAGCGSPATPTFGGPAPYWKTYANDPLTGNRQSVITHSTTGSGNDTKVNYTYPTAAGTQPHILTQTQAQTAPTKTTTWSNSGSAITYGYNADGTTSTRPGQILSWNQEGQLAGITTTAGSTTNIYDADGNLLLQNDPTAGNTLYLWDTQLHTAPGSTTVTAVRTYKIGDQPIAERSTTAAAPTTPKVNWLNASLLNQNTVDDEVNATTGATTHRYLDPYGNPRGTTPAWSSTNGFLNQPTSTTTNTVHLGARDYDPILGRFLSADNILTPYNPLQNNGYTYAWSNPVTQSDPTGLMTEAENGGRSCTALGIKACASANQSDLEDSCADHNGISNYCGTSDWWQTEPSGSLKDAAGGFIHGVAKLADSISPPCIAGLYCANQRLSNEYNRIFDVNTHTAAYEATSFATQAAPALIDPEADIADVTDALTTGKAAQAAETGGDAAYHYTFAKYADSIAENGLRPGTYATPDGSLSPLQAQLDLALPPNRGLPEVKIRVDVAGLRKAGYDIPDVTRVSSTVTGAGGRVYTMPGGGYEMQFPYAIPGEFLKVEP